MSAAPYWSSPDGAIVLHLGDCREVMAGMADKSVGVVLTDPPYSEHTHAKSRMGAGKGNHPGSATGAANFSRAKELGFASLPADMRVTCADEFARLVARWVLVFSDIEMTGDWRRDLVAAGLEYVRTGAWVKVGATPQFTGDRPATGFEAITMAHPSGRKRWNGGGSHAVWSVPIVLDRGGTGGDEARIHTTQKPIRLMRRLVELFTDPGEIVLDPFAGSGTTLAACMERGRRCIGVELDEGNAEKAAKRLEQMTKQGDLFAKAGA